MNKEKNGNGHGKLIFLLIVAVLIAVFAVLNSAEVKISFGFKSVMISQAIVILVSVLFGALMMYILTLIGALKRKAKDSKEKKIAKKEEKDAIKLAKQEEKEAKRAEKDANKSELLQTESDDTDLKDGSVIQDEAENVQKGSVDMHLEAILDEPTDNIKTEAEE